MKRTTLYIAIFAAGLGLGAFAEYELTQPRQSLIDQDWHPFFKGHEDASHARIMRFQKALTNAGDAKDLDTLSRQLEAQLRVEDLIIKSREAEYAKITLLSAFIVALLTAIGGAIVAWLRAKRSTHDTPNR